MKTVVVIGSKDDPQIKITSQFAHKVFFWEDWGHSWNIALLDGKLTFVGYYAGIDADPREFKIEGDQSHLYIRFGGCPPEAHDVYLGIISFHPHMVGVARPGDAPTNKLTQLKSFGSKAVKTVVTNALCPVTQKKLARDLRQNADVWIVKNISIQRSESTTLARVVNSRLFDQRLTLPTLIQEKVEGKEFKYHFYQTKGGSFELNAKIIKHTETSDYRYHSQGFFCENHPLVPRGVRVLAEEIARQGKLSLIDLDYFVSETGEVKVLEWNDSPESGSFESRMALRQNWFFSRLLLAPTQMITIGPQNDRVVEVIAENYFEDLPLGKNLVELRCEFFLKQWNYALVDGSLVFEVNGRPMIPEGIYIRPVDIPEDLFLDYDGLFRAIEMWDGQVFGAMKYGYHNMSKMYQTTKSLLNARSESFTESLVAFPKSYFIKNGSAKIENGMRQNLPMIVKSCSGQRSIVVDHNTFGQWDQKGLCSIPNLFQEVVRGPDIRIHSLNSDVVSKMFGIKVATKDSIDYRYAEDRGEFEIFEVPDELGFFISKIHRAEENPLLGVDFIKSGSTYYCLEANPTPGWNWYYNKKTCKTNFLAQGILQSLASSRRRVKDEVQKEHFLSNLGYESSGVSPSPLFRTLRQKRSANEAQI